MLLEVEGPGSESRLMIDVSVLGTSNDAKVLNSGECECPDHSEPLKVIFTYNSCDAAVSVSSCCLLRDAFGKAATVFAIDPREYDVQTKSVF